MAKIVTALTWLFMINTLTHLGVERNLESYTAPFFAVNDYLYPATALRLIPSPRIFGTRHLPPPPPPLTKLLKGTPMICWKRGTAVNGGISEQEGMPRIWTTLIMPFDP
jgi:hypothetical protein